MNKLIAISSVTMLLALTACEDEISCSSSAVQTTALELYVGSASEKMSNVRTLSKNKLGNVSCEGDIIIASETKDSVSLSLPVKYWVTKTDNGQAYIQVER